jgi:cellulose synthase/poly-beta-1,6-N-acetylglucosamine synthase-like glycosyltransferase
LSIKYNYQEVEKLPKIIVLIPARNESESIKHTIKSIKEQTNTVDRIIVIANNCTDNTAEVSLKCGAEVIKMKNNKYMKAGALNYALEKVIPKLNDNDYILIMDADTTISKNLIKECVECFERNPNAGAISSIFIGRPCKSLLGNLQIMEFWRYRRQIVRNGYRAFVLTGTASLFRVKTLKDVKKARLNASLPNYSNSYYDTHGRTEDNEITLAILKLGYDCPAAKVFSQTDVMENLNKLVKQRERWYNGALINLKAYGKPLPWYMRWIYWKQQIGLLLSLIFFIMIISTIILGYFLNSLQITKQWLIPVAILAIERTATVWPLGWKARIIALTVIIEQIYSIILLLIYGLGLFNFVFNKRGKWHTT